MGSSEYSNAICLSNKGEQLLAYLRQVSVLLRSQTGFLSSGL